MWTATAPANIALIKYMGKKPGTTNIPDNASLSYTLHNYTTTVCIKVHDNTEDTWSPLVDPDSNNEMTLSEKAIERFLLHFKKIKRHFDCDANFNIQSGNNFPHSSGFASSASSFSALTMAANQACASLTSKTPLSLQQMKSLSREGSGSSCRSFYTPWAMWHEETVEPVTLPYENLIHHAILISSSPKAVSSSEAHQRVKNSPNYAQRPQRAESRLSVLLKALNHKDWGLAYEVCKDEFWDMHELFHSSTPSFSYMNDASKKALVTINNFWLEHKDGPIVTMDAGPNIHLLYREDQNHIIQMLHLVLKNEGFDVR